MLYELHEMQRAMLAPWMLWAEACSSILSSPVTPFSYFPFAPGIAAACDLMYRVGREYPKPSFDINNTAVAGRPVPVHERIVASRSFCKLLHFEKERPGLPAQPKVLLFAPLSGHHACLLRDTVQWLLPGHDVYITDWSDARQVPPSEGGFHLDDYVRYAQEFMRLLAPALHVITVCQPAVPVLAAVSLMASRREERQPSSLTMVGGPVDACTTPNSVSRMANDKPMDWFERNAVHTVPRPYPGCGRRVYPGFLQFAGMMAMDPGRQARRHRDYFEHVGRGEDERAESDRQFYELYNAMLDVPAEYYLDTVRHVFKEYSLALGNLFVGGDEVRPHDIRDVAVMTVEGGRDEVAPPGQTAAAHKLCSNLRDDMRDHFVAPGCGHYALFMGAFWHSMVGPRIARFIASHPGVSQAAPMNGEYAK